ncbi:DUF7667 family protein [Paenibacillus thermotolerans]|uniref:DUF7667 family protein n=1 Tax=Paenibacillus thermotolerans TaxID=3027807 RepID=UPI002368B5B6|nr:MULTISPECIES: hypothetical protein [unclassified Paenibacillus]
MTILAIHQRMAELWTIQKRQRELSKQELDEMAILMDANANHFWKLITLENLSKLASDTHDVDWQYELYYRIEELNNHPINSSKGENEK